MPNFSRRTFVDRALRSSLLSLSFRVGSTVLLLTPQEARARDLPLHNLDSDQAWQLEQLGETVVPGSAESGLVHFIDHQLGVTADDCFLMCKYFQLTEPYKKFYVSGLSSVATAARQYLGKPFELLDETDLTRLIREISRPGTLIDEFPVFLFYLCLRSDAVDIVYGTPDGFDKLNVPYMEHIMPPDGWDG